MPALLVLLSLLYFLPVRGQDLPTPTPPSGSIEGRVTNIDDGKPLKDAAISIFPASAEARAIQETTDDEGRFILRDVPAGHWGVIARLPGFAPPDGNPIPSALMGYIEGASVTVASGSQVKGIQLNLRRMPPTSAVSGRLLDENDQPASSQIVQLLKKGFNPDGSPGIAMAPGAGRAVLTDDRGMYRLWGVSPGEYLVRAQAIGSQGTAYYPGVRFAEDAVPITVSQSELAGIDFKVGIEARYSISLRIGGLQELPPDFVLSARTKGKLDNLAASVTVPAREGAVYTLPNVPAGSYVLSIQVHPRRIQAIPVEVVDRNVDLGTIAIQPTVNIEGRVNFGQAQPMALTVMLEANDLGMQTSYGRVGSDGTFTIESVQPGAYRVSIGRVSDRYLATAHYNGREVLEGGLTIDSSSQGPLELLLDGPRGSVKGTVLNARNEPAGNAYVVLVPAAKVREYLEPDAIAISDQNGRFSLDRVRPGEYKVFALELAPPQFAHRNADWLKPYESLATRVVIEKGSQATPTLRMIPRSK